MYDVKKKKYIPSHPTIPFIYHMQNKKKEKNNKGKKTTVGSLFRNLNKLHKLTLVSLKYAI